MKSRWLLMAAALVALGMLAACRGQVQEQTADTGAQAEVTPCPTAEACPECPTCPEPETTTSQLVPFHAVWTESAHADAGSEAFTHWDEEGAVEVDCAKCHSTPGYLDFLGEDGSEAGFVDQPAATGTVVTCDACHNESARTMTSVVFPSGVEVSNLGDSARCMQCHQGRASTVQVNELLANSGAAEDQDVVNADLRFINIHYYAAAATLYGSEAQGGFEFEGRTYQPRFNHVEQYNTCTECHSPHSLEVQVDGCVECHAGATSEESLRDIRMPSSAIDYDGDGNVEEGIYYEIEGLREMLYEAMQTYASEVAGTPVAYNDAAYPYWFIDANENGRADDDEAAFENQFNAFTGRFVQAAYNYQASLKDPGAYAHNAKYIIELLYDSIDVLNEELPSPVRLASANRTGPGHFDASAEAFRHWDEDGIVPDTCSNCHTAEGLPTTLLTGSTPAVEPSSSLSCQTCHQNFEDFAVHEVAEVTFPSGATVSFASDLDSNICLSCHQGRESTVSINNAIQSAGVGPDEVSESLRFRNPHYFAAGATLFGSDVAGAYQYPGKEYAGAFEHIRGLDSCQECHDPHALTVNTITCQSCHGTQNLAAMRVPFGDPIDYDGDGDTEEGVMGEIQTMQDALFAAIEGYTANTLGAPIVYDSARYPYWLTQDGEGYAAWTPKLLRAAYNYTYVSKDPGAFTHNARYTLEVLYDSLEDIGGAQAVEGMTRPAPQPTFASN